MFDLFDLRRQYNQISYDYDFVTPIDNCLDPDDLLIPSLDIMMEKIICNNKSKFNIDLVKRKMFKILDSDVKSKTFLRFFDRDGFNHDDINFEEKIITK